MASDEIRKKWGTIFMGDREASVEQLNAMQEPLLREKKQKEQAVDYMERVRARAADRAREILGAAYAERQKVLDEAKADALAMKKQADGECSRLKEEGEAFRKLAQGELDKAAAEREEAERIRAAAHDEGFKAGMDQAGVELQEFRAELGQSVSGLMHAIERQRKAIIDTWRDELAALAQAAVQAGTGYILQKEHQAILRALVYQALDLLEERGTISMRVNPADEAAVSDMLKAARERFPELRQWIVDGDERVEKGGLIAESGSGRVDLQRENFQGMVDGILSHLSLPELDGEAAAASEVRELVEREVARIAGLTPEPDQPVAPEPVAQEPEAKPLEPERAPEAEPEAIDEGEEPAAVFEEGAVEVDDAQDPIESEAVEAAPPVQTDELALEEGDNPSLAELEEELFPLEEEPKQDEPAGAPGAADQRKETPVDPRALAEGGFV